MRLWSLHPKYRDRAGLTAVWREALSAQQVLRGVARVYRHYPQLARFRAQADTLAAIGAYLRQVREEACRRGSRSDGDKIVADALPVAMAVKEGQLRYEWTHFQRNPALREGARYAALQDVVDSEPHPLFRVIEGEVEYWRVGRSGL